MRFLQSRGVIYAAGAKYELVVDERYQQKYPFRYDTEYLTDEY